MKYTVGLYYKC